MRYCDLKYTLGFGLTEHSDVRLGTSLLYQDTDIGLVDRTKPHTIPLPAHYRIGPFASAAKFFLGQSR